MTGLLDRRRLLTNFAMLLAAVTARRGFIGPAAAADPALPAPGAFAGLFGEPEAAVRLGRRCLSRGLAPADRRLLWRRLLRGSRIAAPSTPPIAAADAWRQWLRARIRQDFADGRLRNLDGWIVAEAEVAGWSLAALEREPG